MEGDSFETQPSSQGSGYSALRSSRKGSVSSAISGLDSPATSPSLKPTSFDKTAESEHETTPTQPFDDFDLAAPVVADDPRHPPEMLLDMLASPEHMRSIFEDQSSLESFAAFIRMSRPQSLPLLTYYLDMTKVMKAVEYANALATVMFPVPGQDFTSTAPSKIVNTEIEEKAQRAFLAITQNDLPPYITHRYSQALESIMIDRVTASADAIIDTAADGLTEVFCLTDPSRPDNTVVFASQAFCEITQYGLSYIIGRNCRFLQGPGTSPNCTQRIKQAVEAGEPHSELILNYRRDGSPFLNLLMHAPLRDSAGKVRYFLGAQVDISNLAQSSVAPQKEQPHHDKGQSKSSEEEPQTKFQKTTQELRSLQQQIQDGSEAEHKEIQFLSALWNSHLAIPPGTKSEPMRDPIGFYEHYLLIRPHPSLRVLFVSPSLKSPDILQTPIMNYIRGSGPVREKLIQALADGQTVSAKVRWVTRTDEPGRVRWIAFTPLMGGNGKVGVWVAVFIDTDSDSGDKANQAAPLSFNVGEAAQAVLERAKHAPPAPKISPRPREIVEEEEAENHRPMTPDSIKTDVAATSLKDYDPGPVDTSKAPPLPPLPPLPKGESGESQTSAPSLEERLRRKRAKEAAMMQVGGGDLDGVAARKTYKSFSPFVPE